MPRSLWKGAISFGLVHIPVELYSAVQEHQLDLTMLDRRDFAPVGFKRYNKRTGKEVGWDDIVKGYEYADEEYVVLSDEDLKRANVKATQTIDILAFTDAGDVPLTCYEHPYYLAPARGGDKVYALLRETLRQAGKIGIASVVIRTKQHLCALVCIDDAIVLNTLRYHDELRGTDELKLPPATPKAAGISDKELKMALSLVDGMTEAWQPEQYRDSYRDDVLALVDKKIKAKQTKTITAPGKEKAAPAASNVVDLVALLKQSLGKKPGAAKAAANDDENDEAADDETDEAVDDSDDGAAPAKAPRKKAASATSAAGKPAPRSRSAATAKPAARTAKAAPKTAAKSAAPRRKSA